MAFTEVRPRSRKASGSSESLLHNHNDTLNHRRISSVDEKRRKHDAAQEGFSLASQLVMGIVFCLVLYLAYTYSLLSHFLQVMHKSAIRVYAGDPKSFKPMRIYMYPLPDDLDKDVRTAWYKDAWLNRTEEYNSDLWVYDFIATSPYRTHDPEEATLFYIPIFPTRKLHLSLHQWNWQDSIDISVNYTRTALHHVQDNFPYWDQLKGRNHFTTLTGDHARCLHFSSMTRDDFGQMFTLQHLGDLDMDNESPRLPHAKSGERELWPCYKRDWDILIPARFTRDELSPADVFGSERNISVLYRFDVGATTSQQPYHGINVRQALRDMYDSFPLAGADWRVDNLEATLHDMARSIFCTTPPGMVAHTSRYFRAIQRGCIPVSFFQGYHLPFQNYLDYSSFTVNFSPYDVRDTHNQLAVLLYYTDELKAMQTALADAQGHLDWETGVPRLLARELARRSRDIQRRQRVHVFESKVSRGTSRSQSLPEVAETAQNEDA